MWSIVRKKRSFLTALLSAIACLLIVYGLTAWIQQQANQEYKLKNHIQIDALLSSYYELYGDWDLAINKLQSSKLLQDHDLRIWSPSNQLLWSSNQDDIRSGNTQLHNKDSSNRHLILLNGQVIGSYDGSFDEEGYTLSYSILLPFTIGLIVFIIIYTILSKQENNQAKLVKRIASLLDHLEPSFQEESPYSDPDILQVEMKINQIAQQLYRLETIRKSMVADIAHELRTPLAVMRAKLDNSLHNQTALELSQVSLLQDEIYRMSKLLGDLQQLSLAESGRLILYKSWFSLQSTLEELTALLAMDSEESGITLNLHADDTFHVYADEDRLKQVLVNIIGNALRYARSTVYITVAFESANCIVTVSDDGVGIEHEEIPNLFERFYRGTVHRRVRSSSTSSGLGLGLPIAKQLMEAHNGTIDVTSRWQQGTTFRIAFPIYNEASYSAQHLHISSITSKY